MKSTKKCIPYLSLVKYQIVQDTLRSFVLAKVVLQKHDLAFSPLPWKSTYQRLLTFNKYKVSGSDGALSNR